jgi:Fe-S-cluster-containing dehydrogenase component/CRP-like cAMP-binding protein
MTTAAGRAGGWPRVVWSAAVLHGIDARGRAELMASGALRAVRAGETIFSPGEPADAFFVVAEGECELVAPTGRAVRRAGPGDALGEEATLRVGASRGLTAVCTKAGAVAEVRATVFRRAAARGGAAEMLARVERTLRRASARDALRAAPFLQALGAAEIDALLDAAVFRELATGAVLHREGDNPKEAVLLLDGLLRLERGGRLVGYACRGELAAGEAPCRHTVIAAGAAWVVALPRELLGDASARARDLGRSTHEAQRTLARGDGGALGELPRLDAARSLLAIDEDVCVRCGQCAWACASVHEDGLSRVTRHGDRVVVPQLREGERAPTATLLLPAACHHCESPACMASCPTGAIGRDAHGAVHVRADLCIGCAQCAKACAWDNVEMAPRPAATKARSLPLVASTVAVKCDLCAGVASGPACVSACPVEAAVRVTPAVAVPHVAAAAGRAPRDARLVAARARAWPWVLGAAVLGACLSRSALAARPAASGAVCGALFVALAGYALIKRAFVGRLRARPWYIGHLALGALAVGAVFAHAGARVPANSAGALVLAFWGAAAFGALAAVVYRVLPARLTRVERDGALPEALSARAAELDDRLFRALTGKSEGTKAVFARLLRPYADARAGGLALLASGLTLAEEERRLRGRIARALEGRGDFDELVRVAVERRGLRAQRIAQGVLRALPPLHVVLAAVALALLVVHVVYALRVYR